MTKTEMKDFLSHGHLARIATVKVDGSPHITPVWYHWENRELFIVTYRDSLKVKNIKRDNRVAVVIDVLDGKGVILEGEARISTEGVEEITRKVSAKYVEPTGLDDYVESVLETPTVIVRIIPNRVISWDYSKR